MPRITEPVLARLARLPRLERLALVRTPTTDGAMAHVARMKNLKMLRLERTGLTGAAVRHIARLEQLEYLDINGLDITDEQLEEICSLPRLKVLHIPETTYANPTDEMNFYADAGLAHLRRLSALEDLFVVSPAMTDEGLKHISGLTSLKRLAFSGRRVTDRGIGYLTSLKNLESLEWFDADVTISGMSQLNALPKLTSLRVMDLKQDDSGLDLSGLQSLETLSITPHVTREGQRLVFSQLNDADMVTLAGMKQLQWLQGCRGIGDEGLAHLAGLPDLQRVQLIQTRATDAGLRYLAGNKNLNLLHIDGDFTDAGLRQLEGLPNLQTLQISTTGTFSKEAVEQLRRALPNLQSFSMNQQRVSPRRGGNRTAQRPNEKAPHFTITALDGTTHRLADYRGKNLLLYVWATWCSPCIATTPQIKKMQQALSRFNDFAMISLSLDDSDELVRLHAKKYDLAWPQVRIGPGSQMAHDLGLSDQAPQLLLIGGNGDIMARGDQAVDAALVRLYGPTPEGL